MTATLRFTLDGVTQTVTVEPDSPLITVLGEDLAETAAKPGCGIGRCGACLVLVDGAPHNACLFMAWQAEGREITAANGLDGADAAILRDALNDEVAFQCGYCAPGIVMSLLALLRAHPNAGEPEIRAALDGHLCRCTGYHSILRGAVTAAARLRAARTGRVEA